MPGPNPNPPGPTPSTEWMGLAEVAAEMKYTTRQAWDLVRRLGMPTVNGGRMHLARFTRGRLRGGDRAGQYE